MSNSEPKFTWIPVYRKIAEKLLEYQNKQKDLIDILNNAQHAIGKKWQLVDEIVKGTPVPQEEVDPFTFFAFFNRNIKRENRRTTIKSIQTDLGIEVQIPDDFAGIPVANNINLRFTGYHYERKETAIPNLWKIAKQSIETDDFDEDLFNQCLKECTGRIYLTMGLYWLNPAQFLSLDVVNQNFFESAGIDVPKDSKDLAARYRKYLEDVRKRFPNKSFAELSLDAWKSSQDKTKPSPITTETDPTNQVSQADELNEPIIAAIKQILKYKRQVILYGPPGTGKTYWANETAKHFTNNDKHRVVSCTFHPEYGYEHFIEGFKPSLNESNQMIFKLEPGIFKELCDKARENESNEYYLIIDEINRGDIPRIFGELITLIEKDKRGQELTLPHSGKPFSVPENVYIIATMNTADRSIALLDIALRRRFGFLEIMPKPELVPNELRDWFSTLNNLLIKNLGQKKFEAENKQIGHSYFMKKDNEPPVDVSFVLEYEIQPLIEEYFYEMKEIPLEIRKHLAKLLSNPKKDRWQIPEAKNNQETNANQTIAESQS